MDTMTTPDTTTPIMTLDSASETITVATALGMRIPAPMGTHAFMVTIAHRSGYESRLGVYQTRDAADNALADWILDLWEKQYYLPWERAYTKDVIGVMEDIDQYKADFAAWLSEHTPVDVITMWAEENAGTKVHATVETLFVDAHPHSRASKKAPDA